MLCHKYKCIFVHVPKTAGQSIAHVFIDLIGSTWEARASLLMKPNDKPELGPTRLAHLKATEYVTCGYVSKEQFQSYFKFAFVRNPWDRILSAYRFRGHDQRIDFKTFLFQHLPRPGWTGDWQHIMPQSEYLYDHEGRLMVDFIGRFEQLNEDFAEVCLRLGIEGVTLSHANSSSTSAHYSSYYDTESMEFVADLYAQDIAAFGYSFELPDIP